MKKTLYEIKKLDNTKPKKSKPKVINPTEYITLVLAACYEMIKEVDKFEEFCFDEDISEELAEKLKSFAQTKSFINYNAMSVYTYITDPDITIYVPSKENSQRYSQEFALSIIKNLAEELESESVESLCVRADKEMQQFEEMSQQP